MITAVDSNVLFDFLVPNAPLGDQAEEALNRSAEDGAVVLCEVVYAELGAHFPEPGQLDQFLSETGLRLEPSGPKALYAAGQAWSRYARRRPRVLECARCGTSVGGPRCQACGQPVAVRQHVLADFLVGAHAAVHADRLLARDRGYYSTYFPQLVLF